MCVSLPAQIVEAAADTALVDLGTTQQRVGRLLVPAARRGDWVLVNAGQIVAVISPDEAVEIRELLREVLRLAESP
jgi:hydrogenase assembly chaperone HypC/HupF